MSGNGHMARALALAAAQLGRVAPNPAVGCVIVSKRGDVIGEGATGPGGRPHAEERALIMAGTRARGATAYVTLEPCARRSTGGLSCSERLLKAELARVVIALSDPHPNADGAGVARLREAGIAIEIGLMASQAQALNWGFLTRVRTGRPLLAIDSDARRYDAPFAPLPGERLEAALDRLGQAGLTRVCAPPGSPLARMAQAAGLVTPPPSAPPCS